VCVLRLDNGRVAFSETFLNKWKAFNLPLISARPLIEFSWPRQRTGTNFTFFGNFQAVSTALSFSFNLLTSLWVGSQWVAQLSSLHRFAQQQGPCLALENGNKRAGVG